MKTITPRAAIVLYESSDRSAADIVSFRISSSGLLTSPGRISRGLLSFLKRTLESSASIDRVKGFLPSRTLAIGESFVIVDVPSQKRSVLILGENKQLLFPSMVFVCKYEGGTYDLRAFYHKEENLLDDLGKECLIPAAFLNTDENGRICLGNIALGIKKHKEPLDMVQTLLEKHFQGEFTEWRKESNKELVDRMEKAIRSRAKNKLHGVWKHLIKETPIDKWMSLNALYEES